MSETRADEPTRLPTYRVALRSPGFPALLSVWTLTIAATSLQIMALSVLVYEATGSATLTSAVFAAGFLPQVLGGLTLNSLADRLSPLALLVAGAALRAVTALVLAVVPLAPGAIIVLVAAVAVTSPLFIAVQSSLAARILPRNVYVLGRSMLTMASAVAQLGGLAVGGALVSLVGGHAALYICAGLFLIVGLLSVAAFGRRRLPPNQADMTRRWRLSDTWRTNRSLLSDRRLRSMFWLFWLPSAVFVAGESLTVPYAAGLGATDQVGLLLAAFPAGALIGDFVVGRWVGDQLQRRLVRPLLAVLGAGLLVAWFQPPLAVSVLAFAIGSIGFAYQVGLQRDFLEAVPETQQGQAFGLLTTGTMTGQGIGPILAGLLADRIGVPVAIGVAGSALLAYAAWHRSSVGPANQPARAGSTGTR